MKHAVIMLALVGATGLRGATTLPPVELVSRPYTNTPHVFGDSSGIELSADGKWAMFNSSGNGLATNDNNGLKLDLFLRNNETGSITLISRNLSGGSANGNSINPLISADGRFVLFESDADDLIAGDTNASNDVFLYDRDAATITLISKSAQGIANGQSGSAVMTSDARFILFESDAADLSSLDQNGAPDLYLLDRTTGGLKLVTLNAGNSAAAAAASINPFLGQFEGCVSGDGRFVAYLSSATNAVPSLPTNAGVQLFLRDMLAGTNIWISRTDTGRGADTVATPVLSRDGTSLAFLSSNLSGAADSDTYLYIYAIGSGELRQVQTAGQFAMSGDGKSIAYADANSLIYLYDLATRSNQLVSVASDGSAANDVSSDPAISDDGRVVLFTSAASNLSTNLLADTYQLYRFDRASGSVALLSKDATGTGAGNEDVVFPVLSGDGLTAGFMSYASNLAEQDDKNENDVFLANTSGAQSVLLASTPDPRVISASASGSSRLSLNAISADGRYVVFTSDAPDLVPNDDNGVSDVFLKDLQSGEIRLVSVSSDGIHPLAGRSTAGPVDAGALGISGNGEKVVFISSIPNSSSQMFYAYDVKSGTNAVASVLPSGEAASGATGALSTDGHYLAFTAPSGSAFGLYLRDLRANSTILLTNSSSGSFSGISPSGKYVILTSGSILATDAGVLMHPGGSLFPPYTSDTQFIMYPSAGRATSLYFPENPGANVTFITNSAATTSMSADGTLIAYEVPSQVSLYDVSTGATLETPIKSTDTSFPIHRDRLQLNRDGRYLVFESAVPFAGSEGNGVGDVFLYDRALTNITLLSHSLSGEEGNQVSSNPAISADGGTIVFASGASDLVENDRNVASDIFVVHLPITDSDQNGLEDGWERLNFGATGADPKADPDHDGMSNLEEFLAGTNPNQASSALAVQSSISAGAQNSIVLQWPSVLGKNYQIQYRSDLSSGEWQNLGNGMTGTGGMLQFAAPLTPSGDGFYRVHLMP